MRCCRLCKFVRNPFSATLLWIFSYRLIHLLLVSSTNTIAVVLCEWSFDPSNRLHCCLRLFKQHCLSYICTKWVSHQYEHRSRRRTVWTSLARSVTFPAPAKVTIKICHCANGDGAFDAQNGHNVKLWRWRYGRGMVTLRVVRHLFIKRQKPHAFESNLQKLKAPKEHATETSSAITKLTCSQQVPLHGTYIQKRMETFKTVYPTNH